MGLATWGGIRHALSGRAPVLLTDEVQHRAAVALILSEGPSELELLFIRRSEHPEDPWSGHMAFPGGRSEPGEIDLRATAIRETAEETGLSLEGAEYLGGLDEVRAMAELRPMSLTIRPFVFRLPGPGELRLSPEARSAHWIPLPALLDPASRDTFEYRHRDEILRLPCLRFQGMRIWGLTYRMFMNFSSLLAASVHREASAAPGVPSP